jgi:KUP system potassium uptake protein
VQFFLDHGGTAFLALGSVVLAVTGAEALYADMGHFGRRPIRRAWFLFVFPALVLNYLGQGALVLESPGAIDSPFFRLIPEWGRVPMVILAMFATVIASQAVISGAFSVSRQAVQLGLLPPLRIRQTSEHAGGQVYLPAVNWALFAGVIVLLVTFRSSERLATAYGLAVTGTFLITSTLFLILAESAWGWKRWQLALIGVPLAVLELTYFAANLTKVAHGGWLPLLIALVVATVMLTWQRGRTMVTERRTAMEGPLAPFIDWLHTDPVTQVPGTAVFLHPDKATTPLALRENAMFNHVIHETVLIVSTVSANVPHIADEDRVELDHLGDPYDAITHLTLNFGFQEDQDVPAALALARAQGLIHVDPDEVYYFLSRISLQRGNAPGMSTWRKRIFLGLAHNAASPTEYFRLPEDRTVAMGATVAL